MLTKVVFILIQTFQFVTIFLLIIYIANKVNTRKILSSQIFSKIGDNISQLKNRNSKINTFKIITPLGIVVMSVICFLLAFILIYSFLRLFVSSVIISIPFAFIPYTLIKLKIEQEKNKIKRLLPIYAINLKGHMSSENNIILGIKRTKVEEPLYKHMSKFIVNIERGMNITEAFNVLRNEVDVLEFSDLISAFQVCYQNGGKFVNVLDVFSKQMSNLLILQEKEKEKNLSSIITLMVMLGLNIFLVVSYVFGNIEFARIIRESFTGHIVMDINAISCVLCIYFLFKMYKLEE